ncbi:chloride channel protein [Corynebacterium hansenii]|uniref:Chloride channel protein n=1 Tax=Corynebacterium hansenii TaxID=394964 RepID=A0ABV7ZNK9_9CORY|nr:chloride channel protein [Corynebacterium hansenii]WJY99185.1 Voltage-gated ClC-type chloride channel ClcB [Corynebacterium hansenii]
MTGTEGNTDKDTDKEVRRDRRTAADLVRLCLWTFVVGVATGLFAALLVYMLHGIESIVYGQHEADVPVVTQGTSGVQRFLGITVAGLIAAPAWWAVRRLGRPIQSVEEGMSGARMPVLETLINVFLQMGTVAAGASVGRENAPREAGAMMSTQIAHRLGIDRGTTRLLVAAAAGAGLGAIYHIPLAGAVFAFEILLTTVTVRAVMVVLACSAVATVTAGIVVGDQPLYSTVSLSEGFGNLTVALALGVICGIAGMAFRYAASRAEAATPKGAHILWALPLAFATVGAMSLHLPEVLGNGRFAATSVLESTPVWTFALTLVVAKIIAVLITLRSGAVGGVLTPGFAIGALLGYLVGFVVQPLFPGLPPADFALLGAAAFLSTSMAAPLFALIVTVEFTGQSSEAYLALFLACATAALTGEILRSALSLPKQIQMPWSRRKRGT